MVTMRSPSGMNEESTTLSGWWVFAGVLLLVAGVLNIIYGIAAIGDSKFFTENATYIISGLHTWGWVMLIIGVLRGVNLLALPIMGRLLTLNRRVDEETPPPDRPAADQVAP